MLKEELKNKISEKESIIQKKIDNLMCLLNSKKEELLNHAGNALDCIEDGEHEEIFTEQYKQAIETIEFMEHSIKEMFKTLGQCSYCPGVIVQHGYKKYKCRFCEGKKL